MRPRFDATRGMRRALKPKMLKPGGWRLPGFRPRLHSYRMLHQNNRRSRR